MANQELICFGIVAIAFGTVGYWVFRDHLAQSFADWLLRHGKVKWAMRIKFLGFK